MTWLQDVNSPEQFGFAKNQITPFNFTTPDHETIYAWHVMPLGLYAKHESEILQQPSGLADDITQTTAFRLLRDDPDSRLIINSDLAQNAGTVAQGWRTDSYRSLSDGSTSNIHILAIDYRGFGLSTGSPTEEGLITDGVAAVDWALQVAKVPSDRIVILGQSLGTAVTSAVAEHYAMKGVNFAGVVLVAGFTSLAELLPGYSIAGYLPVLSPLKSTPAILELFSSKLVDKWPSASRISNFVRLSKRVRLFILHARDDYEIPWTQSQGLFAAAANATTDGGMDLELLQKMKARTTVDTGDGTFISTWKAGENKIIRQEVVAYGHHSRVLTYATVSLAALKAFGLDDGGALPVSTLEVDNDNECQQRFPAKPTKYTTMADESKHEDPATSQEAAKEVIEEGKSALVESENEDEEDTAKDATPAAKKKKSKRKKIKAALGVGSGSSEASSSTQDGSKLVGKLDNDQAEQLLKMNPGLAAQIGDGGMAGSIEALKKMSLQDIMTGLASSGKNVKDMGAYKFWSTQPVPRLDDKTKIEVEGPIKEVIPEMVRKEAYPLSMDGFEWVTMDLTSDAELKEVYDLLYGHYVEDDEAMFRFNYSKSFLKWALTSPGWFPDWHRGIRATVSRKLVAFISAIPVTLRVREKDLKASEVNFMVVHKKLRSRRLAPLLIKEITRLCHLQGVYQAIYTGGVVLPKPVSTCRYFHRSIDWKKLNEVGFSPLPKNSKPEYQVRKYALPDRTATKGLRPMEMKDIDAVLDLLRRYLATFDMAPQFTREEVEHWLIPDPAYEQQVIWSYVVEDPTTKKLTDYFSFYCLESSIINNEKHSNIRAAYLYYYASEIALDPASSRSDLKTRLNALINDALILAKKYKFDVFNALTLLDNGLFLEQQKFGAGDGQLHYYLFNYNANPIAGGVDQKNLIDDGGSGVGVVML
ncbi:Glycylpeptide N-tetradecanoyltransferase [Lachnellula arida]|uniref:Glycylpeptide N-tetradecanoyltransferase n=1 Tax=Lachnellula arida TaxID=1316785 RepID=A0A8T9BAH6_9HELO|nr:Glycylpeptide N-tetradecanoyltransferase [Lachnellula arida]